MVGLAFLVALALTGLLDATDGGADRASVPVAPRCPAAPVQTEPNPDLGSLAGGRWIATTPRRAGVVGFLFGGDVVGGRVVLYVGGVNPVTGAAEKVLWVFPTSVARRTGGTLALTARKLRAVRGRLRATGRRFTQRFAVATSEQTPGVLFPSVIDLPDAGCWLLTLRTGRTAAQTVVLARFAA